MSTKENANAAQATVFNHKFLRHNFALFCLYFDLKAARSPHGRQQDCSEQVNGTNNTLAEWIQHHR